MNMKIIAPTAAALIACSNAASADVCARIKAFNDAQSSMADMMPAPCHCIPINGRLDKVYKTPPPGMTCGNHLFYDKKCHSGLSCGPK